MKTRICDMLGTEYPILAFSHCRDVVAAVTNAGGFGVLGAAFMPAEQLDIELRWIDEETKGRPYGVDLLFPTMKVDAAREASFDAEEIRRGIPDEHKAFVDDILRRYDVPPMPEGTEGGRGGFLQVAKESEEGHTTAFDVAFGHGVRLVACGLGVPPKELVDQAHQRGTLVAALIGQPAHAVRQVNAGVDIIVAQGSEAGGHTGEISTFVLVPQVVDAVAPVPVLAAGGIASGRQLAAALALGAEGVWCGSVWLTTEESETLPHLKNKFLAAGSADTIRSRSWSGKPMRMLRSAWPEEWEKPGAPAPLPTPLQDVIAGPAHARIARAAANESSGAFHLATGPVGQVVGMLDRIKPARQVVLEMATEYLDVADRFRVQLGDPDPG